MVVEIELADLHIITTPAKFIIRFFCHAHYKCFIIVYLSYLYTVAGYRILAALFPNTDSFLHVTYICVKYTK